MRWMTWRPTSPRPYLLQQLDLLLLCAVQQLGSVRLTDEVGHHLEGVPLLYQKLLPLRAEVHLLGVAAQLEFESTFEAKLKSGLTYFSFKRLKLPSFNLRFAGSACTAPPRCRWRPASRRRRCGRRRPRSPACRSPSPPARRPWGRCLHSSTSHLNLSRV